MKKLIAVLIIAATLLFASPTFAYTVKSGDTMTGIARENSLTLEDLARLNPQIPNLDLIYIDQYVNINELEENAVIQEESKTAQAMVVGYSENEMDLLARLVRAEAQSEPYQGKIAVACVVLNRVDSPSFPDTIKDVIYQKGQFQPVQNGQINNPADEDSIKAVNEAMNERRNVAGESLFFYNPAIATSRWLDSKETTLVIGDHVFKQ